LFNSAPSYVESGLKMYLYAV